MKNNLLSKFLMPYYIAAALFMGVAGTATFFAEKNIKMAKEYPGNHDVVDKCRTTYFVCLLIIMVSIIMAIFNGVKYPMITREKVKTITKHYLQGIFTCYPETREYRFILENSRKLHEIAAIACNGLSEDEQKKILDIVNAELRGINGVNCDAKLHKIETAIIDIVQKHAVRDPEYMNKILAAIVNAKKPDITETIQKVR